MAKASLKLQVTLLIAFTAMVSALKIPGLSYPLHASCKINWNLPSTACNIVHDKILSQIDTYGLTADCNGTEKCLYSLVSQTSDQINAFHLTPVKRYKDNLSFTLKSNKQGCQFKGESSSDLWYAVLDYGTNYCNLHNLITGSGIDKLAGYTETTDDSICTQYSTANCEKY